MKKFLVIRFSEYSSPYVKASFDDERKAEIFAELSKMQEEKDWVTYYVAVITDKKF